MEHLETQVSDLRSFLPAATTSNTASIPIPVAVPDPMTATAAAAAITAARHSNPPQNPPNLNPTRSGSQAATASPASAFGPNSAHPSPTNTTTAAYATYPQHPQHAHPPRNLSLTPSSAYGSGAGGGAVGPNADTAAGSKRKADGNSDDASQKQQRSKRNRVRSMPVVTVQISATGRLVEMRMLTCPLF